MLDKLRSMARRDTLPHRSHGNIPLLKTLYSADSTDSLLVNQGSLHYNRNGWLWARRGNAGNVWRIHESRGVNCG